MYKPIKRMCDVCGGECKDVGYKLVGNGWCCRECYKKAKQKQAERLSQANNGTTTTPKLQSETRYHNELNAKNGQDSQNDPKFPLAAGALILAVVIMIAVSLIASVFSTFDNSGSEIISNNETVYREIEGLLQKKMSNDLATRVTEALFDVKAVESDIDAESISVTNIASELGIYEINAGIAVRIYVSGNGFKLYTYKGKYLASNRIILYDSSKSSSKKILTKTEFDEIKKSQRMNYISSVISISTANGVVSNLSTPYFTITVGNVSGKTIKRIYIEGWEDENTDGKPGWSYVGDNSIATDHNRKYIIYGQGWSLNSSITLSQIVVYFEDGSSVVFDEYDCKIMFE